jgi:hypothetical protein
MVESGIRIGSFYKDLHPKRHFKILRSFEKEFNSIKIAMSEGYHPEVNDSPLYTEDDSTKYRSIINFCICIVVLGIFDIVYDPSTISRFNIVLEKEIFKQLRENCSISRHFQMGG